MVSARCKAKSKVLRAEVSTPPTWMVGLAYGLPASRSTMLNGAVGGFSPWTRRRSIRLAAASCRSCAGVSGSVLGRPSVVGLDPGRSGRLVMPGSSLCAVDGLSGCALQRQFAQQCAGGRRGGPGELVGMEDGRTHRQDEVAHQLDHLTAEALLELVAAVAFLVLPGDAERAIEVVARVALLQGVQHHSPVEGGCAVEVDVVLDGAADDAHHLVAVANKMDGCHGCRSDRVGEPLDVLQAPLVAVHQVLDHLEPVGLLLAACLLNLAAEFGCRG